MKGIFKETSEHPLTQHHVHFGPYSVEAACAMVYYAAERTLMSMVLMVIGLMGLGFVIDRFGLVLLNAMRETGARFHSIPYWTGSLLVITGSIILIIAIVHFIGLERRFHRQGCGITGRGLTLGVLFALFVAMLGAVISVLLITVRS